MFHRERLTGTVIASALAVIVTIMGAAAEAQVKPFKIRGEGTAPEGIPGPGEDPRPHWIVGNATHLGRHVGAGTNKVNTADFSELPDCITGEFESGDPFVFVGANGDELVCDYGLVPRASEPGIFKLTILDISDDGQTVLVEAEWVAEFVARPDECTGKFTGVTGSWIMYAWSEPFVLGSDEPVDYAWEGEGKLSFSKARK